jgi:hypothetical protein
MRKRIFFFLSIFSVTDSVVAVVCTHACVPVSVYA